MSANNYYAVEILLPGTVEDEIRKWAERTPGATWPDWGGHITVLSDLALGSQLEDAERAIGRVCARFDPFALRLSEVVVRPHWRRAPLQAVLLVGDDQAEGQQILVKFRHNLHSELAGLEADAGSEPAVFPYVAHVSLTWGLTDEEAARLAEAARTAKLQISFTVQEVWLLEFTLSSVMPQLVRRVRSFALGSVGAPNPGGAGP